MKILLAMTLAALITSSLPIAAETKNESLSVGAIQPEGWMLEQMKHDLKDGFVGRLDLLVPEQMLEDDIYGRDRRTKRVERKDVGTRTTGAEWEVQFLWWNSETQSNWWDGYIRNILLTDDDTLKRERLDVYIRDKLATVKADGYIGIYGPDLRYRHTTENGELWAQATLFRGLLAYQEATDDAAVLEAVQLAVAVTMKAWPIGNSQPFKVKGPFAGIGHGLMLVDVLDTLARITGDDNYRDYAVFLFEDYNRHQLPEADIQIENLMDPDYRFQGHGVHTYEHLRALVIAAYHTGRAEYRVALDRYLAKLDSVLTTSGGPIGDEWIVGRHAHPSATGYEYCSLQELLHSYGLLLEKSGEAKWADRIEWLLYNAAQGARHPNGRHIAYVKTDNAFHAMGHVDMSNPHKEERVKYSAAHRDVAICCVPNAGRIYPYFLQAMYHRTQRGLSVDLYGASEMTTKLNGSTVRIRQITDYPFEDAIRLEVETESLTDFEFRLRVPSWATGSELKGVGFTRDGDWLKVERTWEGVTRIEVRFERAMRVLEHANGTLALAHGPLLYALPINHQETTGASYGEPGFEDIYAKPMKPVDSNWQLASNSGFELIVSEDRILGPFDNLALKGSLYSKKYGRMVDVELVPMGGTVLRQVSFDPFVSTPGGKEQ